MEHVRVIRKYPNRRLYDTHDSCYVALRDVGRLVQEGIIIKVIDKQTRQDITSGILLQIIIEQEKTKQRLLTITSLHSLIRGYARSDCELVAGYLEQSLEILEKHKQQSTSATLNKHALAELTHLQEKALNRLQKKSK